MLTNPVYTGMGPYPAIIKDEEWLAINAQMIARDGPEVVVRSILARFLETFPSLQAPDADPFIRHAQGDPVATLRQLLAVLRICALASLDASGLVM